jgi:hypothetical protein
MGCGELAMPSPKKSSASATDIASTSLMSLLPSVYFRTSAWNRLPSQTSQVVATPAIIARSL